MEVKKDILWRVYLGFILMAIVGSCIMGKAIYIQQIQGNYWRGMSDSLHQKIVELDAERGTIYSEDGSMLSTSIPQFDMYIDFMADGLRDKNGKRFKENIDSLSICLANLFKDKSSSEYKRMLQVGYREKDRYFLLRKKMSFKEYEQFRTFPLVRLGRNKSGFIPDKKMIRLNPYQMLAYRTIGLLRDSNKVGLELTYDDYLQGSAGKRLVRFISGGVSVPVDDYEVEPENGKDVITTLDVNIQDITENALMNMMIKNEAQHGCAIVMEVKTGKIKAIANLGRDKNYNYWEDYNYAITPTEPGSVFKLATMLSLLEDKKISLNDIVDLNGGTWQVYGRTVFDSENHGYKVTIKQAFELSSNVGMAKLAVANYSTNPNEFINHIKKLRLDSITGIDLKGEIKPSIYSPSGKHWSNTTLPWMAFGYNLTVSPLQMLTLYNAVANNGKMMKPYLVNEIREDGRPLKQFEPVVLRDSICSNATLHQLKECLEGVVLEGTAKALKNNNYSIAGKTGTALVANGNKGYADHIYQSTFAGYFPADNPQYTIIVVIKNKPFAANYFGASVAGPVFKEISDHIYSLKVNTGNKGLYTYQTTDSSMYNYAGYTKDIKKVTEELQVKTSDALTGRSNYSRMYKQGTATVLSTQQVSSRQMPSLNGMGLKDAVYLCENLGLKVMIRGRGKVSEQSLAAGQNISRGQNITIQLN